MAKIAIKYENIVLHGVIFHAMEGIKAFRTGHKLVDNRIGSRYELFLQETTWLLTRRDDLRGFNHRCQESREQFQREV